MASLFIHSSFLSSPKPSIPIISSPTKKPPPPQILHTTVPLAGKTNPAPSTTLQTFWDWLSNKGVVSPKSPSVKPGIVPEGLGLISQKIFSRNEVVVEVPSKVWINSDTVAASEIGGLCGGLKPWASIALFLLREKGREDSPWRSYIEIMPSGNDSTIFWSEEELSELQGTQLLGTTVGVKEYVQSEFLKIEEEIILPNKHMFPTITLDDFLWAFAMLRSRAFSNLRGQNLVLIPLADLINHSPGITIDDPSWEIKGGGLFSRELKFSLRTPIPVKAGDQVKLLYSLWISLQVLIQYDMEKSNAGLALDYGFIESRSDRNVYTLTLEIPESDPFFGDKLDIAEANGFQETAYFDIILGRPLPQGLLPYLRLVALEGPDAFLLESIFRNSIWGHLELPISRTNEELICQVVRDACKTALSNYHTTIEEDEKLMQQGNLDPKLEIAVGVRAGEKKVLEQIDGIFKERELELDVLEYYQERRLKDLGLVGEQGEIIFWEPK
ncbi:hypothetical protein Scep_017265 [Stephania cephalantha]|uniref:Rubisco LSMT substrate-binding domain-containing protein n=1 Tax=Stephania cephalantha TaxID=152367 RepID=A0AAP0IPA5_9MAGN